MAVSRRPNTERIYETISHWVDICLRGDGSLFTPGIPIWTATGFRELHDRFNLQPDASGDSFLVKLKRQLDGSPPTVIQLMGEVLYVHLLVANDIGGPAKRRLINEALGWAEMPVAIPDELGVVLNTGLANTGVAFNTYRPNQLWFLIDAMAAMKALDPPTREGLLNDPWEFKSFLWTLPIKSAFAQRESLLHFVHPETFEVIVSRDHKEQLRKFFSEFAGSETDVDRALVKIRDVLQAASDEPVDFYRPPYDTWRATKTTGSKTSSSTDATPGAWLVRGANVLGTNLIPSWLQNGYCSIGWPQVGGLDESISRDTLAAKIASAFPERTDAQRRSDVGNLWRFVHEMRPRDLVVTIDGSDLYVGEVTSAVVWVDTERPGDMRRRAVTWFNAEEPIAKMDLPPATRSTLNAQSTVCDLKKHRDAFLAAVKGEDVVISTPVDALTHLPPASDDLAASLLLPKTWLQEVVDLLDEKRQIVLYGPPGTGKTYLARAMAEHIVSIGGVADLVQFHPSYAYEDFFEGFRPRRSEEEGSVGFELVPGPLRRLAEQAATDPANPYVLVIDEINRANLAKVFGELYFLLEYRDDEITLQYSPDDRFRLPPNVYVVGTMNTADRSIALVDAAMRRRFYFIELSPGRHPIDRLLRDWLARNGLTSNAAVLLDELNRRIGDPDALVGPSYLMSKRIDDEAALERVWRHAILPLLEERYIGTGVDVESVYGLAAITKAVATIDDASQSLDDEG